MILCLDAATTTVVVGCLDEGGKVLAERRIAGARGDSLPGLFREVLDSCQAKPTDIQRVVCGVGPGSFTGIRIALAYAHGLAFRRELPLAGVSSLRAAALHPDLRDHLPLVVLDALRDEAYVRDGTAPDRRVALAGIGESAAGRMVLAEGKAGFLERMPPGWRKLSDWVSAAGLMAASLEEATPPLPNYLRASAPEELRAGG